MGIIDFSMLNPQELSDHDEVVAEQFEARRKADIDSAVLVGSLN